MCIFGLDFVICTLGLFMLMVMCIHADNVQSLTSNKNNRFDTKNDLH